MYISHLWQACGVVGIVFLLLEIFIPSMFFLNFAVAAFVTAIMSVWFKNVYILMSVFLIFSFLSFIFLRPIFVRKVNKSSETGLVGKYIGQVVVAESNITGNSGQINIYGERWDARSHNGECIPAGSNVKILRNESIIMYVKQVD